jgi:hypothetical protein
MLRASLRPARTELLGAGAISALVIIALAVVLGRIALFDLPVECRAQDEWIGPCAGRQLDAAAFREFITAWASKAALLALAAPYLIAVILGISAVGKEVDQHTAVFAWSVAPSRRRWLLLRVLPFAGVAILAAIGSELLVRPLFEVSGEDPTAVPSFLTIPIVGLAPVAAVLSTFAISTVVGAIVGRILPALLAAIVLAVGLSILVFVVNEQLMRGDTIVATEGTSPYDYGIDTFFRTPDGEFVAFEVVWERYGNPDTGEIDMSRVTQYVRFVPIAILPQVAARYQLLHLVLAFGALTLAFAVVERRVP